MTRSRYALALVPLLAALAWGTRVVLGIDSGRRPQRAPFAVPNPAVSPPLEAQYGAVRHIFSPSAPERLVVDTVLPDRPARLLWFAGRPTAPLGDGVVTTDGTGGVVRVDGHLRPHWVSLRTDGRDIVSVAPADDGGWWLASAAGEILRADGNGQLLQLRPGDGPTTAAVRTPIPYPDLTTAGEGRGIWLVRSPERFGFGWYPTGPPPVALHLAGDGKVSDSIGPPVVPNHALLTDLANAGRVVSAGDTVWYVPFIRDEVIALGPKSDTLWVTSRGLTWAGGPPRFEVQGGGQPVIDYMPVNLGIALGLDGLLYVLSTRDSSTTEGRLDVFDRGTGRLLRSADLSTTRPTLAADDEGRVYALDAGYLLTGVEPRERPMFPPFDLERLGGGRMTSAGLQGSVTLINFWASWCTPCRTEMPALDSLRQSIMDPRFAFLAIDEDVQEAAGRKFIADFGFDFPVVFGRGKMRERYHYPGLPYTVLLDREGRVAQRWFGYSGPEQIGAIRAVIGAELARSSTAKRSPAERPNAKRDK